MASAFALRSPCCVSAAVPTSIRPSATCASAQRLARPICATGGSRPLALRQAGCQQQRVQPTQQRPFGLGSRSRHISRQPAVRPCAALPAVAESLLTQLQTPPLQDFAACAFAVAGALALVKFFETLRSLGVMDQKLSRKLVHTLAGPGFLLCWPLFSAAPGARYLAMIVPALNGLRLLLVGTGAVKDEKAVRAMTRTGDPGELLRGPLYYVIVLLAVTGVYWRDSPVGLIITALMCGGDGLADIIGRRLGASNPLPWNKAKSWAGSTAMFLGGFVAAMGLIAYFAGFGYIECEMGSMALTVATISLVAAVIESLPINQQLDDNLSVPGVAAFMGILMLQMAVEIL